MVAVDRARIEQLEAKRRACAREAKKLVAQHRKTDAARARFNQLLVEAEAIDAELERAFYPPRDPGA